MSIVVVGGVVTVGALAAMYLCGGGGSKAPPSELDEVKAGTIANVNSTAQLQALFEKGGKCVVYLSATW